MVPRGAGDREESSGAGPDGSDLATGVLRHRPAGRRRGHVRFGPGWPWASQLRVGPRQASSLSGLQAGPEWAELSQAVG